MLRIKVELAEGSCLRSLHFYPVPVVAVLALKRREAGNQAAEVERTVPKVTLKGHDLTAALTEPNHVSLLAEKLMGMKNQ